MSNRSRCVPTGYLNEPAQILRKEAAPRIRRLAVLCDPPYTTELQKEDEAAAAALGIGLVRQDIGDDFARTFADLSCAGIDAVLHHVSARQFARRAELIALAAKYRMKWVEGKLSCEMAARCEDNPNHFSGPSSGNSTTLVVPPVIVGDIKNLIPSLAFS